jgi:vacuolar iron transporter family protein
VREPAPVAAPGGQARLNRILGRESWHQRGGSWISGAIYGANDGLAAVFGIVTDVSGATGGSSFVLTAGLAGAVASALSMATGAFLAERSEAEVMAANVERERQEIAEHPEEENEELSLFYQLKGIDPTTADQLAERLAQDPDAMLKMLSVEEFGASDHPGNPTQASLAAGLSAAIGAIIPVIPFIFTTGTVAIVAAAIVSLVAHFLVGAAKSLVTLRSWWSAGLEMTLAGVIVGGATTWSASRFPPEPRFPGAFEGAGRRSRPTNPGLPLYPSTRGHIGPCCHRILTCNDIGSHRASSCPRD